MSHNAITTLRTPGNVSPTISDKGLLRGSIGLAIISLVGFGLLYPLAGVGLGQALFPTYSVILTFVIMVAVLALRPQGILGRG